MTVENARAAAIKALEDAVTALTTLMQASNSDCDDVLAVDAVLLVGVQWYNHDGERCGNVISLPRHGSQPYYATVGLLDGARQDVLASKADR